MTTIQAAAVLLACLGTTTRVSSQDTIVVRADNEPVWGPTPTLVEELRIGSIDGEDEAAFGFIWDVFVDGSGVVWVADGHSNEVRRYGPNGQYLGAIGREGEGPGEFQRLRGVDGLPDGRIAAFDDGPKLVSIFTTEGEFLHRFRVPKRVTGRVGDNFKTDSAGFIYVGIMDGPQDGDRYMYLRMDSEGEVLDTLRVPPSNVEGPRTGGKRYGFGVRSPFHTKNVSHLSPFGYLVTGRNDNYSFRFLLSKERVHRVERHWDPVQVKRQERAAIQVVSDHFAARNHVMSSLIPRTKPPFWAFWVDQDNRLWVARHREGIQVPETPEEKRTRDQYRNPPNEWIEPLELEVIGPDGQFLGTVNIENLTTKPVAAKGNLLWVIEEGEWGEQYVVRYRIEPG